MSDGTIWLIDRTLSGATTPIQSGPGRDVNAGVLCNPHISSSTGASQSDCLVSYPGYSFGESYTSAEMQPVYSAAQTDWITRWGSLTPLQTYSQCILQPQPTKPARGWWVGKIYTKYHDYFIISYLLYPKYLVAQTWVNTQILNFLKNFILTS